jgi:serine/threonine-protein kinase
MPTFQQPKDLTSRIYLEDTDRPLPEVLNPKTRYRIISTIAKGGKSLIQSCQDMHLGRVVAYKTLRPELRGDPIEERRLLREARISAMLQHPNTMPTYELGRDGQGNTYFTMKLVHGYTLREVLNYRERYDLSQLIEVLEQVANAVQNAHVHGVVHRDIKPENVLVGPYGEVLLLDWGFAKVWKRDGTTPAEPEAERTASDPEPSMTGHQKLQGTLCYMAPEQILKDADVSYAADIYSLGVILYEVLAGRVPFEAEYTHEVLEAVKTQVPEAPSSVSRLPVPRLLEDLAMRCLRKSPAERPDVAEFIRTLQEDWHQEVAGNRQR